MTLLGHVEARGPPRRAKCRSAQELTYQSMLSDASDTGAFTTVASPIVAQHDARREK
jgi:hypothetical protein